MENIKLNLLASDFKNANYLSTCHCPVANAARRHFNIAEDGYVNEGVECIQIEVDGEFLDYKHDTYGRIEHFNVDMKEAILEKFSPDVVIRNITLIKR